MNTSTLLKLFGPIEWLVRSKRSKILTWSLTFILLFPAVTPCNSQTELNLGFEKLNSRNKLPITWVNTGQGYAVTSDTTIFYEGKSSLKLDYLGQDSPGVGIISNLIPHEKLIGKNLEFRGKVKVKDVSNGFAGLWLRIMDSEGNIIGFNNMSERPIKGTIDWKEYVIQMKVDNQASQIVIGGLISGRGSVWFDDFKLFANGTPISFDNHSEDPLNENEVKWLEENSIELEYVGHKSSNHYSLDFLKELIGDATIVSLGESTHGTKEFFEIKCQLVKHLISNLNFEVFSMESNLPESYSLNDYLNSEVGNSSNALKSLRFWTWQTRSLKELLEWLKNNNKEDRLLFTGFDMQSYDLSIQILKKYLSFPGDTIFFDSMKAKLDHLRDVEGNRKSNLENLFKFELSYILRNINQLNVEYDKRNWLMLNLRLIEQYLAMNSSASRDKFMAENLSYIINENSNKKVVVWSHNGHVKKTGTSMGKYLGSKFGEEYLSIGFAFHEGRYNARGPNGIEVFDAIASYPGTYEFNLNSIDKSIYLLDLRKVRKGSNASNNWLLKKLNFRTVGSEKLPNEFFPTALVEDYDLLIFFKHTTESQLYQSEVD